jgi:acetate kinase
MRILVINSGSSSIKFRLLEVMNTSSGVTTGPAMLEGALKGIGGAASIEMGGQGMTHSKTSLEVRDHGEALRVIGSCMVAISIWRPP